MTNKDYKFGTTNIGIIVPTFAGTPKHILRYCAANLKNINTMEYPVAVVPNADGAKEGTAAIYENIIRGINLLGTEYVYICDHDCIYPEGYFDFCEVGKRLWYAHPDHVIYMKKDVFLAREIPTPPLSTLYANTELLLCILSEREPNGMVEPGYGGDKYSGYVRKRDIMERCQDPVIDIRHGNNWTGGRKGNPVAVSKKCMTHRHKVFHRSKVKKDDVEVVIPCRREPLLSWTIDNIKQSTGAGVKIRVVHDGYENADVRIEGGGIVNHRPWNLTQGVGPSRHYGIDKVSTKYVVICDAHMSFGDGWLDAMIDTVKGDCTKMVATRSGVLRPNNTNSITKVQSGARLTRASKDGVPLGREWYPHQKIGKVQLLLGGCYAFNKDHYYDIGQPWRHCIGWGMSEQIISLANYFAGGINEIVDTTTNHVYRDGTAAIPYNLGDWHKVGRLVNALMLINAIPASEGVKASWRKMLGLVKAYRIFHQFIETYAELNSFEFLNTKTWEDWLKEFGALPKMTVSNRPSKRDIREASPQDPNSKRFI